MIRGVLAVKDEPTKGRNHKKAQAYFLDADLLSSLITTKNASIARFHAFVRLAATAGQAFRRPTRSGDSLRLY